MKVVYQSIFVYKGMVKDYMKKGMIEKVWKKLSKEKNCFVSKRARCNNVDLGYKCNIAEGADVNDGVVGCRTSIGRYTTVRNSVIGKYCSISWNCSLGARNHPFENVSGNAAFFQPRFGLVEKKCDASEGDKSVTTIGNDVWIGCNAVVMSGVTVGDGAIIGAGAIVTKDVEPYSIVVGVPAMHYRYRFEEEIRQNLLKAKWWDWHDKDIIGNLSLFQKELTLENSKIILEISNDRNRLL